MKTPGLFSLSIVLGNQPTAVPIGCRCSLAHAAPTSVAAALPNEKAECRYLLDLCQRLSGSMASLNEVIEVAHVIRAKHVRWKGFWLSGKCGEEPRQDPASPVLVRKLEGEVPVEPSRKRKPALSKVRCCPRVGSFSCSAFRNAAPSWSRASSEPAMRIAAEEIRMPTTY